MLEAHQLTFGFGREPPLFQALSMALARGEWVGLSGASGAGKSTLGRVLAGHWAPRHGFLHLDGEPLPSRGLRPVQWLPQSPERAVNPRWRVARLLEEAWTPPQALREAFGIQPAWLKRFPGELSGGELQRVCVLRALAPGVRYLIADEISTMLDPLTQLSLWQVVKAHAERQALGVLVISHDTALLNRLCTRHLHLADGQLRSD